MILIIWISVFVTCSLFTYALAVGWSKRQRAKVRVLNLHPMAGSSVLLAKEESRGLNKTFAEWLAYIGEWVLPNLEKLSPMRKSLIKAGYRRAQAVAIYMGLRIAGAFLLPLPLLLYLTIKGKMSPLNILFALCFAIVGFYLPTKILDIKIKRRQDRLDRALPDILDLFVICMEAGLSLNATISRVSSEIHGIYDDFYDELQLTAMEIRTGIPWDEAFDNLGKRTDVQSVRSVVGLMIQSDKLGASIAEALRHHSEFIRTQRLLRAEERAQKLPVKMLFPTIFFIFPAILIVVVGPGIIHIVDKLFKGPLAQSGELFKGMR
jgi:tight adherence protein C